MRRTLVIAGLCATLLIFGARVLLGWSIYSSSPGHRHRVPVREKGTCTVLCLTERSASEKEWNDLPSLIETRLNQANEKIRFRLVRRAVLPLNTTYVLSNLENDLFQYRPDIVVLMMGESVGKRRPPAKGLQLARTHSGFVRNRLLAWASAPRDECGCLTDNTSGDIRLGAWDCLRLAITLENKGDLRGRTRCIEKAMRVDPENSTAYLWLGYIHEHEGDSIQAVKMLKKAIETDPQQSDAYVRLGIIYKKRRLFIPAEEALKKAVALSPTDCRAQCELSDLYRQCWDSLAAERALPCQCGSDKASQGPWRLGKSHYNEIRLEQLRRMRHLIRLNTGPVAQSSTTALQYDAKGKSDANKGNAPRAILPSPEYSPFDVYHLRKLGQILHSYHIPFMCVQYPLYDMLPLRDIFKGHGEIMLVDSADALNEAIYAGGCVTPSAGMPAGQGDIRNAQPYLPLAAAIAKGIRNKVVSIGR